jgi:hypothetical protein
MMTLERFGFSQDGKTFGSSIQAQEYSIQGFSGRYGYIAQPLSPFSRKKQCWPGYIF